MVNGVPANEVMSALPDLRRLPLALPVQTALAVSDSVNRLSARFDPAVKTSEWTVALVLDTKRLPQKRLSRRAAAQGRHDKPPHSEAES